MKPLNDLAKIKVTTDEFGFAGGGDGKAECGILVELPDKAMPFFGFHSFAFEDSYNNTTSNISTLKYYQNLVGKRVYWVGLSERGMVLKEGDNTWAFVKLTDLIAFSEPDVEATLVTSGAFNV